MSRHMKISMKIGSLPFLTDAHSYTCISLECEEICNGKLPPNSL